MKIIADAGPLLHLFWVGASSWPLPLGRVPLETAVATLQDLPRRGRLHVRRRLIELAVEHLAASN